MQSRRSVKQRAARFGIEMLLGSEGARPFLDVEKRDDGGVPEEIIFRHHADRSDRSLVATFEAIDALRDGSRLIEAYARASGKGAVAWLAKGRGVHPQSKDLGSLYEAGHMVSIRHIERFVPEVIPLCRLLESDLRLRVGSIYASCFLSTKEGIGAVPHVDRVPSFNIQLTGEKRWHIGNTPHRFPATPKILRERVEIKSSFVVRPGSVVFVAPGVVHATEQVIGSGASLAIGFSIESRSLAELIGSRIFRRFQRFEALRASPLYRDVYEREARRLAVRELRKMADQLLLHDAETLQRRRRRTTSQDDQKYRLRVRCVQIESDAVVVRTSTQERRLEVGAQLAKILDVAASAENDFSLRSLAADLPTLLPAQIRASLDALARTGLIGAAAP